MGLTGVSIWGVHGHKHRRVYRVDASLGWAFFTKTS